MIGAIVLVLVIVVVIPVTVLISGGIASAVLGAVLKDDGEARNEGSELVELNR